MGIISNTVSICQFNIKGNISEKDMFEWGSKKLSQNGFIPIDNNSEEESCGWVHMDDTSESNFSVPQNFWRDNYFALTLRRDKRKIPAILLKSKLKEAEIDFLSANPACRYVPKQKKEDLKDAVRSKLFSKTLPSPAVYDAVWNTNSNIVTFTSLSTKMIEIFETQFKKTFEGLSLEMIHPFSRAESILTSDKRSMLQKENKSSTNDILSLIKNNQWIGYDFLLWLMYMTMNGSSKYPVNQEGPLEKGSSFTAYLNDRLVLLGNNNEGVQKVSISGPQSHFLEVKTALKEEKQIIEAMIYMEKGEEIWNLTLKGDVFHFASFKCPNVKIEKDNLTNKSDENEAVFYERMLLLEKGLQLFDSIYATFLKERLEKSWEEKQNIIKEWFNS